MNIDELTIGDAKELANMFGGQSTSNMMLKKYIGKYVIARSRNEGINAGKVLDLDETGVILEDARRLYYHKPASKNVSWYEGVATGGISKDSKVGCAVEKVLVEDYSLIICTEKAEKSIRAAKDHEQN